MKPSSTPTAESLLQQQSDSNPPCSSPFDPKEINGLPPLNCSSAIPSDEEYRLNLGYPPWKSVSFACGGWLYFYMFGVSRAIQARGLDKGVTYCGCSAGALSSAGIVFEGNFDKAIQYCKEECVPQAYSRVSGLFRLSEYIARCVDDNITPNYKAIPAGTLQIAVTKLPFFTPERITSFDSAEDLKTVMLASSAAFPFASLIYRKGSWYIDGGLSDFQPMIEGDDIETLTVSPFYFSDRDIKPSRYVSLNS